MCLIVALTLRLAFVFLGFPALEQRWHLREDGDGYGQIAQTIRDGRYDDLTRGPVYPVFVALAGTPLAAKLLQALIDTATVLLVWQLAGKRLWVAWLWALYPFAIWRVAFINKEVVLTFLLASSVCVLLRAQKPGQWIATGVLLGIVNLCKPSFLLWPVVLLAFAPRRAWLTLAAMVVVIAPWTYRNWRVTGGEFLPVATEAGGVTTFIGNYPPTLGLWEGPGKVRWMAAVDEIRRQNAGASVVQLDRAFYREAGKTWRDPATALNLFIRKCGRFWFLSAAQRERVVSFLIQTGYLALLGIGLWRRWPWSREVGVMVALIGYVMLVHALSYADLRFSLPVMPYVCALAGNTLAAQRRAC
jgi:hypothetical protein